MAYLLDINVLIALTERDHVNHLKVKEWFLLNSVKGWATCPITENGFIRILSNSNYPGRVGGPSVIRSLLNALKQLPGHQFWSDEVSLSDIKLFPSLDTATSKSITDLYLLASATRRKGKLATLDQRIDPKLVEGGLGSIELIR